MRHNGSIYRFSMSHTDQDPLTHSLEVVESRLQHELTLEGTAELRFVKLGYRRDIQACQREAGPGGDEQRLHGEDRPTYYGHMLLLQQDCGGSVC